MRASFTKTAVSIAVFLIFALITVGMLKNENRHKRDILHQHTETTVKQIKIRIEGMMNTRISSLSILAERWVERKPPDFSYDRFIGLAKKFFNYYPGFLSINWIDSDGIIQWVISREKTISSKGVSIYDHSDPHYIHAFKKALEQVDYSVTPCVYLFQGGLGFEAFLPLIYEGGTQGYLNGVFQLQLMIDTCLAKDILKNFIVKLYEEGNLIFQNTKTEAGYLERNRVYASRNINFPGKVWTLDIEPKKALYKANFFWDAPLLIFGLIVSLCLSLIIYFLIGRIKTIREARDYALAEIRKRKHAESVLKKNEDKLEGLLSELDIKNKELETFVYSVSHDLKTPIVTIEGFAGALREDFGKQIPKEGEKYLDYISDATRKMDLLINDLLSLARIGVAAENRRKFSFANLVSEVLISLQPQIKKRGVQVSVQDDLPDIYATRKQLAQVMDNLLSNAIKYIGNDNPSPHIDIGLVRKDDENLFFVRDNGIGIDEKYMDRIFQVFERLPAANEMADGTGIGLTIVKRIIENHEGRIWVDSQRGKGSTFYFTLT